MNALEPASTLQQAYRLLEPNPLNEDNLSLYASRSDTEIERLILKLTNSDRHSATKWLVTGHRGNGKSTEFQRLRQKLQDPDSPTHLVVYVDVNDPHEGLDLNDIQIQDLLLFIGLHVYRTAYREGLIADRSPTVRRLLDLVRSFRVTRVPTEGKVSAKLNLIFAEFAVDLNKTLDFRRELREDIDSNYNQLLLLFNELFENIAANAAPRSLLVVVDSMDRLTPERALAAFHTSSPLRALKCHAIYTPPLSIFYHADFAPIRLAFENNDMVLPNVLIKSYSGANVAAGREFLGEILRRRLTLEIIEPAALEQLITLSGGLPRELVYLAREACTFALLEQSSQIEAAHVERSAAVYRNQFTHVLTADDYPVLCAMFGGQKRQTTTPQLQMLLHKLVVMEYADATESWYDVHPVVTPLLEERCHDNAA